MQILGIRTSLEEKVGTFPDSRKFNPGVIACWLVSCLGHTGHYYGGIAGYCGENKTTFCPFPFERQSGQQEMDTQSTNI